MTIPHVDIFATREAWLQARLRGIGSSDAPAVLGISRWASPLSLYHEKRGLPRAEDTNEDATSMREIGLLAEPLIAQLFAKDTKRNVQTSPYPYNMYRDLARPWMQCSVDRWQTPANDGTVAAPGLLELKNVSVYEAAHWLETGEVPLDYQVQVQHQMRVTGAPYASVAALIGGTTFRWADIARDEELIGLIEAKEVAFWDRVQRGDPPPADSSEATRETLKRLAPQLEVRTTALPVEFLELDERRMALQQTIADAQKQLTGIESTIQAQLVSQNANRGVLANGVAYTWLMQNRKGYEVKPTSFPVMRRSEPKRR